MEEKKEKAAANLSKAKEITKKEEEWARSQ